VETGLFAVSDHESRDARDEALARWLEEHGVDLVVLAGFMELLGADFIRRFEGRVINVHPSLLPAFAGGMDAVERALAAGVEVTGCTVHLVTDEVDAGPVLLQATVPVLAGDTPDTLHRRIQREEHRILPEAIDLLVQTSASLRQ
jgi:phosphoribosylglycinamide formyltransferase-1